VSSSSGHSNQVALACEKLRQPLTRLAGAAGFSSLLSRALAMAKRESPSLKELRVEPDGSLAGFDESQDLAAREAQWHGGVILIAELLGLLVTLIGEPLTLSLVHEAWPDASVWAVDPKIEEES
jgi:hypothetical protein